MLVRNNILYDYSSKWTKKTILDTVLSYPHWFSDSKAKSLPLIALKELFLEESNRTKGCLFLDPEIVQYVTNDDIEKLRQKYSNLAKQFCIVRYKEYDNVNRLYKSYTSYGYIIGSNFYDLLRNKRKNISKGEFSVIEFFKNEHETEYAFELMYIS